MHKTLAGTPDRRTFLELAGLGTLAVAAGCTPGEDTDVGAGTDTDTVDTDVVDTDTGPAECVPTSADIEGPFWVEGVPVRQELDLYGEAGTHLSLSGTVLSVAAGCAPLAGAVVEIWHADPHGAYDNSSPELRYRGQTATDDQGRWSFSTLKPGIYKSGATYRPSHVHVKVWVEGVEVLTTQLYFEGDPWLEGDPWAEESRTMEIGEAEDGSMICSHELVV